MPTAFEKWVEAVNKTSTEAWTQKPKVIARRGKVVRIEWRGFEFRDDGKESGE